MKFIQQVAHFGLEGTFWQGGVRVLKNDVELFWGDSILKSFFINFVDFRRLMPGSRIINTEIYFYFYACSLLEFQQVISLMFFTCIFLYSL
ncbi:MAG: hypothetical protein KAS59_02980 [Alphaproteobacteria bacterium]|nr:hypothetical protein [Alphaproteobacteria bacterium]MCK5658777.1 hypothetical protein [Alphaproteobacteria bacterium]